MELKPIPAMLRAILEAQRIKAPKEVLFDTAKKYNGAGASAYGQAALTAQVEKVATAADGTRNNTLNTAAFSIGQLVAGGELDYDLARCQLVEAAQKAGLSDFEAEQTTDSGLDAGMENPRSSKQSDGASIEETSAVMDCPDPALLWVGQPQRFDLLNYPAEDGGILDLWCDLYRKERMFSVGSDRWFRWCGTHWQVDTRLMIEDEIERLMDTMNSKARQGLKEAIADKDKDAIRLYGSYIGATKRSKNRVASVEGMARAKCAVATGIINTGNTLNLRNGVLDLDTLELRPHDPTEHLTYCLSYDYDPTATCPRFERFTREVLVREGTIKTDLELVQLYNESLGYALTNDTRHEAMFWFSGDGGNGKTVAVTILQRLLGPLCFNISFETMGLSGNYDLADVSGKRVIFSTESERGGKLAEGHIKRIVSGERINARPIYGSPFEFQSTAKIFWAMNDLPVIRDTSNGIWRRLKLIPFLRTFAESEKDIHLLDRLQDELPGILNLALAGLKSLRERGRFPDSVASVAAVDEYRHESNPVQQWLNERTQPAYTPKQTPDTYPTTAKALFDDYKAWAEQNGRNPMNNTNFGREMRRLAIPKDKDVRGNVYALIIL